TLARWAAALQRDFAARMDWCQADAYSKANHTPQAVLNGDSTSNILYLTAQSGDEVQLTAEGSRDPDSDALTVHWWVYPEAGTYRDSVSLSASRGLQTRFTAPPVKQQQTLHILLQIEDDGAPSLTAYRRAVVAVSAPR
ncbi:MAG: hypothetical protein KDA45_16900, partial [Planctomycetales bacterium]|nr:hypothetical protein [Planctomycetales bacterium]